MAINNELVIRINGDVKEFQDALKKVKKETEALESQLTSIAKVSGVAFTALSGIIGLNVRQFAQFEKGLIGVGKTTGITGEELDRLGKNIVDISKELPNTTNELLAIGQAAGQLGVKGEKNITLFTETIAKLGSASDLSGEEAATALTRILNVTGEGVGEIDKFASVIVRLGNNFAASESEIARMATEVSRATSVFGVNAAQAAALSAALRSVGVRAELGGSAVGRAFRAIDKAVRGGGKGLENLAELTGETGDELKRVFEEDSVRGFQLFIDGLGRVQKSGGDTASTLEQFGLSGEEILKVLPVLAQRSDLVADALNQASNEFENATALNEEAATANKALSAQLAILRNTLNAVAIQIGSNFAPVIQVATNFLKSFFNILSENKVLTQIVTGVLAVGVAVTGLTTTLALGGLAFLKYQAAIATATGGLGVLSGTVNIATLAFTGLGTAIGIVLGPITLIVAGVTALGAAFVYLSDVMDDNTTDKWTQFRAVASATLIAIGGEINNFVENALQSFGGLGQLIVGVFTLDKEKIKEGLKNAKDGIVEGFFEIGQTAGETFQAAYDQAILDSDKSALIEKEASTQQKIEDEKTKIQMSAAQSRQQMIDDFNSAELEKKKALLQNLLAQDQEFQALSQEQKAVFEEENRETLLEQIETEKELEINAANETLKAKIKADADYLKNKKKFGKTYAGIVQFLNKEEVQGAKDASSQLVALKNSESTTLQAIGKAASLVQIGIKTAEGAISAYAALAGIPIVGPGLGAAAAAALVAYGAEQTSRVLAANTGGVVPLNMGQAGVDSVPAMLTPGEIVAPAQNFDEVVNSVADRRNRERDTESTDSVTRVELSFRDDAVDFLEATLIERGRLKTSLGLV